MINTIIITINFCNAMTMNCAFMVFISNHYGRKCLCIIIQLEPYNDIFMVNSNIMAICYELTMTISSQCKENELCIDIYYNQS